MAQAGQLAAPRTQAGFRATAKHSRVGKCSFFRMRRAFLVANGALACIKNQIDQLPSVGLLQEFGHKFPFGYELQYTMGNDNAILPFPVMLGYDAREDCFELSLVFDMDCSLVHHLIQHLAGFLPCRFHAILGSKRPRLDLLVLAGMVRGVPPTTTGRPNSGSHSDTLPAPAPLSSPVTRQPVALKRRVLRVGDGGGRVHRPGRGLALVVVGRGVIPRSWHLATAPAPARRLKYGAAPRGMVSQEWLGSGPAHCSRARLVSWASRWRSIWVK